ncbi:PREDICTED: protein C10 [Nicrophorus vespilloides]|uniref:Protein C10 n=1 Tax=Nicrophorus vespilloides TaxID=110193 RepID=A0ABM1MJ31_NICVS|nr:PREDICTED: protein C10 [Nicrophorus vespilloides]
MSVELTVETVRLILKKTIDELQTAENVAKLEEAKSTVGNEMLKMMQLLFPIVMQIQIDSLKQFGYPEGRETTIKFAQVLRNMERVDPEIARLHSLIKAYYLPSVSVNAANETSTVEDRLN